MVDLNTIIILALLVVSLGTIWNYLSLKKSMDNYWKLAKPEMTKKQIRELLDCLLDLKQLQDRTTLYSERREANALRNELEEILQKADMVIHRYYISVQALTNLLVDISKMQEKKHYKALDDVMFKHMDATNEAYMLLEQLPDIWPEVFERKDIKDE